MTEAPWNESNPDWWQAQVEERGEYAWPWLVNEWKDLTATRTPNYETYPGEYAAIEAEAAQGAAPLDPWHPDGDCLMESACGVTGFYCSNWRAAPRAEGLPEPPEEESNDYKVGWDAGIQAVLRAAPRAEGLDVERLAEAMNIAMKPMQAGRWASRIAAEYARLTPQERRDND